MKNLIELSTGYLNYQLGGINELVRDQNQPQQESRKKRAIRKFYKNKFCKCIGVILLVVTYANK